MDRLQQKRINTLKINNGQHTEVLIDELERVTDTLEDFCKELEAVSKVTVELRGPEGKQGPIGLTGKDGRDGIDGKNGKDGRDGVDGKNGKDGKAGINGKDGRNGVDGMPGTNGTNGKDGSPDTGEQIVEKINALPIQPAFQIDAKHIKNLPKATIKTKRGGGGGTVSYEDLTSQCNGVLKTFTVPLHSRVIALLGTQFPVIYRPLVDFTTSGTVLTLTDQVSAPETGQTLTFLYA